MSRILAVASLILTTAFWISELGADPTISVEYNRDRAGIDYTNFVPPAANKDYCIAACAKNKACDAYTYVKPGYQGSSARCWLKTGVPTQTTNSCCDSGKK